MCMSYLLKYRCHKFYIQVIIMYMVKGTMRSNPERSVLKTENLDSLVLFLSMLKKKQKRNNNNNNDKKKKKQKTKRGPYCLAF